jgi:hypothetical protein
MSRLAEYSEKIVTAAVPPLLALTALGLERLPPATLAHLFTILTAWGCISLPLAVVFGHCALGEE